MTYKNLLDELLKMSEDELNKKIVTERNTCAFAEDLRPLTPYARFRINDKYFVFVTDLHDRDKLN